jgi:predicted Zn-dependent peptidase
MLGYAPPRGVRVPEGRERNMMTSGEQFLHARLRSGIDVVGEPMAGVESAAIGLLFGAGARDEPAQDAGISHFNESLLFRGTETRDARQLSETFDSLGASYDSSAGIEMTLMSAHLIGTKLLDVTDLLIDCARSSIMPQEAVDSVRTLIQQEIRQREDRPPQKVMDLARRTLFAGSPLGNDVLGTPETVNSIGRDDLVAYYHRYFHAGNVVISIAGNFAWEALLERLDALTDDWAAGEPRPDVAPPVPQAGISVLDKPESVQENLGFAFPGVPAADSRYFATGLLAQVLGGGTSSRLHLEVREKRGLAYSAQARFDGLKSTGLVRLYVGTSAERAPESVAVVYDVLRELSRDGVHEDELARAKTRLKSQVVMRSESTYARMASNLRSWWMEGRLYDLKEVSDRIDAVTTGDILAVLAELHIDETVAAVALGPRTRDDLFDRVPVGS